MHSRFKSALLLLGLAACWGPSFLFIKIFLEQYPPFTLVAVRLTLATGILWGILAFQGKSLWQWRHLWKRFVIMGFFANAFPFLLITYSELYIPTALAGIVNGSPPIFTALLAHYFIPTERLTWSKGVGIAIGVIGLSVIFFPALAQGLRGNEIGITAVTIASMSYAVGMVYARKNFCELPSLIGPTAQIGAAALMTIPFMLLLERPWTLPAPRIESIASLLGMTLLGTVFAFILYYEVIKRVGATYLSTSCLLYPLISLFLGLFFLGETLSWNAYLGCALILIGLVATNRREKKPAREALDSVQENQGT